MATNKSPLVTTESENIKILNLTLDDFDLPTEGQKSRYPCLFFQSNKWRLNIKYLGKEYCLGRFDSEEKAFRVAIAFWREHPFFGHGHKKSSKYLGVFSQNNCQRWRAEFCRKYLGLFEKETDAALAYDKAARERWGYYYGVNQLIWPEDFE